MISGKSLTEHFIGNLPQFVGDVRGLWQRLRAGDRREVGEADLEVDDSASQCVPPQSPTHLLRQIQQPGPQHLLIIDVPFEGRLVRDRLRLPLGHHRAIIDPVGQLPEMLAM